MLGYILASAQAVLAEAGKLVLDPANDEERESYSKWSSSRVDLSQGVLLCMKFRLHRESKSLSK